MNTVENKIEQMCKKAKAAASEVALLSGQQKDNALLAMAKALKAAKNEIITINEQDVKAAKQLSATDAFIDRMVLTSDRFDEMVAGIKKIAEFEDPVGRIMAEWNVPSELHISRVSVPLGVIAVIYESRPNVSADAASLCFKSGNAIILRGGTECADTNRAIIKALRTGLKDADLNADAIQYVPEQSREAISTLIKMDQYIDVIIPRGGKSLIKRIAANSRIPVFLHLDGICHTYVHEKADLEMAINVVGNAKMRRPGICGATETLLIDKSIANDYLPKILDALIERGCEVRGDQITQGLDARVKPARDEDWTTEYLDAIISVKVVDNVNKAIAHINHYGSHHTDAIISDDFDAANKFLQQVDSANVMHNCSTQFADGGEFGMGAEIGIATGKLHARGPVGLEQLTTFKYIVKGSGQVRA